MGIRKEHAPRALFSELEDGMIKRLQEEVGNKWTYITERINESSECEWDPVQVRTRFMQLEIEEADGHKKKRRVNWTPDEDAQLISLCKKWLKRQTSTYGMYAHIVTKMPGKTIPDLRNHWERKLSKPKPGRM